MSRVWARASLGKGTPADRIAAITPDELALLRALRRVLRESPVPPAEQPALVGLLALALVRECGETERMSP